MKPLVSQSIMLDGVRVEASVIDPAKHRFLGAFRPPENPLELNWTPEQCAAHREREAREGRSIGIAVMCPCGATLWNVGDGYPHWLAGHCDILQYETIKGAGE